MTARQRWLRVLVALLVLAPCGFVGAGLRIEGDIARMLPRGGELERIADVLQQLTARTIVDVGADGPEGPDTETLCTAAAAFAADLVGSGAVAAAEARPQAGALELVDVLRAHAPALLDDEGRAAAAAKLDPAAVDGALATLRRRLLEPDGAAVRQRAAVDPLGFTDVALKPLQSLFAGFRDVRLRDGCLVSADGRHVLVLVTPGFAPTDLDKGRALVVAIDAAAARLAAVHRGVHVRWLGSHRSSLDNAERIVSDVWLVSLLGLVASTALAVLFLGLRFALLSLVPAACGAVVAIAALALWRGEVSGAALGFGSVLCGLCLDFTVHVLFQAGEGRGRIAAGVVFLAAGSTAAAQLVLLSASLPGLCDVGVFGAVATLAAAGFAVWLLPALVPARGRPAPLVDLPALLRRLRPPTGVRIALLAVLVPAAAWFAPAVGVDGDVRSLSAVTPANAADEVAIGEAWGDALSAAVLVVEAPDLETALQRNEELAAWLAGARARGVVRDFGSLAGILPSARTQTARLAAWRQAVPAERRAEVAAAIAEAAPRHGFKAGAFAPFAAAATTEPALLPPEALLRDGGPLADKVRSTARGWQVQTAVFVAAPAARDVLRRELAAALPDVLQVERGEIVRELLRLAAADAWRLGGLALLVVAAVLFVSLVRLELVLLVVVPLLVGLLLTLGAMGAAGVRVTLANSAFAVFLFGIAVDYAILLLHGRLDRFRSGDDGTGQAAAAVWFCGLTTLCGFGVLVCAGHPVLRSMGLTAVLGIGATLVASLLVVPTCADLVLVRRGPGGSPGLRHLATGLWVFATLAGRSAWHRLGEALRGPDEDPAAARRGMLGSIQATARHVHRCAPYGTRTWHHVERLPAGPCVYVSNHESIYDTLALLALPRPLVMLVKPWVWRAPVVGPAVRAAGFLCAGEGEAAALLEEARERLAAGLSVLVFPEGTRSRDGRVGRFHSGAFRIAARLGAPIVPIALLGTRDVVPPASPWVGDHDVHLAVLEPVDPAAFPGELGHVDAARAVRARIAAARAELAAAPRGREFARLVAGAYRYLGPVVGVYAAWKARLDPLVAAIPGLVPADGPLLVAGCGHGLLTTALAAAFPGRPVHAIDYDERKAAIARAAAGDGGVRVEVADLRETPLPEVAAALLVDVLHYWPDAEQRRLLAAVARALPVGGRLVFRDGCADRGAGHARGSSWERFARRTGFTRGEGPLWYRPTAGWSELLAACGFRVLAVRPELGRRSDTVFLCEKSSEA